MVHRQQLDGRDAQVGQVLDRRLGGEPGVAAAQVFGHVRVQLREALDVQLVDQRLVPGRARRPVVAPGEGRVDHRRQRGIRRAVAVVEGQVGLRVAELVAEQLVGPAHVAADRLGVRVEHDLVGIEAVPAGGLVRPVDAVAVELAGQDVGQVGVPDLVGVLLQRDPVRLLCRRRASRTGRARPWSRSPRRGRN